MTKNYTNMSVFYYSKPEMIFFKIFVFHTKSL